MGALPPDSMLISGEKNAAPFHAEWGGIRFSLFTRNPAAVHCAFSDNPEKRTFKPPPVSHETMQHYSFFLISSLYFLPPTFSFLTLFQICPQFHKKLWNTASSHACLLTLRSLQNFFGTADAVHRRRNDTACIACALTAGI